MGDCGIVSEGERVCYQLSLFALVDDCGLIIVLDLERVPASFCVGIGGLGECGIVLDLIRTGFLASVG